MIVYIGMFLYVFFMGTIGKIITEKGRIITKYNNKTTMLFAILILALPVFFIGMRTNYIDTKGYMEGYLAVKPTMEYLIDGLEDTKSKGWLIYEWLLKFVLKDNATSFLMVTAIIQAGAVLKLFYKHSRDYSFSVLIFFLSCAFVNMMNGIRQFMAITIILYFSDYLFEKKYIRFLIVVLIAFEFHASAIVWLPMMFVVQGKPWRLKTLFVVLGTLGLIFALDNFTDILEDALVGTSYEGYTEQFSVDDGSNIFHTLIAAVPTVLAFAGRKCLPESDTETNVMVNISLMGVLVSLMANFTSGILIGRLPIYFTIFNFALFPTLFDSIFADKEKLKIRMAAIAGYVAYAYYYMTHAWGKLGMPYISDVLNINTWHRY